MAIGVCGVVKIQRREKFSCKVFQVHATYRQVNQERDWIPLGTLIALLVGIRTG